MQNILALWSAFDTRRRIGIAAATFVTLAAILGLASIAAAPRTALLYSGLDEAAAGEVIAALEQRGVAYEVEGGAIRVDAAKRDELRMTLAAEGMPAAGAAGYELLDGLSGFGTTSQMFDAAYWRAKEGELARTSLALPQIRSARVHISRADPQPFRRDERQTASITVTTASGGLPPAQAKALRHLVASAVAGMRPEDVAVIDSSGGLVPADDEDSLTGHSADARATELKHNVERLLAARVGPGKAVVEVAVDLVTDREEITERRFDPEGRVAISTDTEEKSGTSAQSDGQVTVASNLPDQSGGDGGGESSQSTESRERVNYEISETSRAILRAPGAIRKLSVAVLVDGVARPGPDGAPVVEPRTQEELDILRDLVTSAVGYDETRGDVVTLRSLTFEPVVEAGTLAEAGLLSGLDIMSTVHALVLAIVAIVLGVFVIRPLLMPPGRRRSEPAPPLALPGVPQDGDTSRILTGVIDDSELPPFSVVARDADDPPPDPVARLRRLIEERQTESIEILRGWMEDRQEKT